MKDALAGSMTTLPAELRRSLTWDRGKELAQHVQFRIDTGFAVYFALPLSPWQRGTNENTNGLLRQYFPTGADLSRWTADDINAVAAASNGRPREILGMEDPGRGPRGKATVFFNNLVLQRPVESGQYTTLHYTESLALEGIRPSTESVRDAYDSTLMGTINGLFKTECTRTDVFHTGPYKTISDVDYAVAGWVDWYNNRRLHSTLGMIPPAEQELAYYAALDREPQPQ